MAVIPIIATQEPTGTNITMYSWLTMGNADTGTPMSDPDKPDMTLTVDGTFGGATVVLEGSNDGTNYHTLTNPEGVALSFTAAAISLVTEVPLWIKPATSGGSGTSLNVYVLARRASR